MHAAPAADAKKADQAEAPPSRHQLPAAPGDLPGVSASPCTSPVRHARSLDPKSGYRMLVTLTNAGASVVRAEMSSPRYRDQEDWNGYLGDLELKNSSGGVQVQVVGAGTPAANAKIEAGDVIVGVGNPQTTGDQERCRSRLQRWSAPSRIKSLPCRFGTAMASRSRLPCGSCGGHSRWCGRRLKTTGCATSSRRRILSIGRRFC